MLELEKTLNRRRSGNRGLPIHILSSPDEDDLTSLGALYHAIGS